MRTFAVVGIALACGPAQGCGSSVDPQAIGRAVEANLTDQALQVASVSCPDGALPVRCRATLGDGTVVTMEVERAADGEGLSVSSAEPMVIVQRLVPQVRAKLEGVGHAVASVACDGLVWRTHAGAVGRCEMTDERGRRWVYEATFTGQGSQHRASIFAAADRTDDSLEEVPG